jgi:hypothetical protein
MLMMLGNNYIFRNQLDKILWNREINNHVLSFKAKSQEKVSHKKHKKAAN